MIVVSALVAVLKASLANTGDATSKYASVVVLLVGVLTNVSSALSKFQIRTGSVPPPVISSIRIK